MKLLYVVLDGAADLPIRLLNNQTPLEFAEKPHLDELSAKSRLGLMNVISKDIAPESDQATLALLGFDPFEVYTGRGPLEAFGSGIKAPKNSIVLRCNFAFQEDDIIKSAKVVPDKEELKEIEKALADIKKIKDVRIKFKPTIGHRAVLILEGKGLSANLQGSHPGYIVIKNFVTTAVPKRENVPVTYCRALDKTKNTAKTVEILNDWLKHANSTLEHNKFSTNLILVRGAGSKLPKLKKMKGWALMADLPLERAIGHLCGMAILPKPTNPQELAVKVKAALKKYKALYVQIKGTDDFSHNGDFVNKARFIETLDAKFIKRIVHDLGNNVAICITSDHTTSSETKTHTANPVPVLLYVPDEDGDYIRFTEKLAAKGSLGKLTGIKLFRTLQKLLLFD